MSDRVTRRTAPHRHLGTTAFAISPATPQGTVHRAADHRQAEHFLANLNEQAEATFLELVKRLAAREDITEQLKAQDQMLWVQQMNNIRDRAIEVVNNDLIYA